MQLAALGLTRPKKRSKISRAMNRWRLGFVFVFNEESTDMTRITNPVFATALALILTHIATPAMARSPCPTSSCDLPAEALIYGIPVSALSVAAGTFLVPAIANNIADQDIAYWKLSLANFAVSTATATGVAIGTLSLFKDNQAGGYVVTCALAPIAASALTSWAMHTFMDKEPAGASAAADGWFPTAAMVVTPEEQSLLLGWRF